MDKYSILKSKEEQIQEQELLPSGGVLSPDTVMCNDTVIIKKCGVLHTHVDIEWVIELLNFTAACPPEPSLE